MKAKISKNNKFIQLSERPKACITHGLKVYLQEAQNEYSLPVASRSVVANKIRYSLKELGYPNVVKVEILDGDTWNVIT